jgi:hypothetical protein
MKFPQRLNRPRKNSGPGRNDVPQGLKCRLRENPPIPQGTAERYFQLPIRDWTSLVYPTQHCVLGYSQTSLRD